MQEIQKISIKMPDQSVKDATVISFLKSESNEKTYVLYTIDDDGTNPDVEIYASIFIENGDSYELKPIETSTEWDAIQEVISSITEESGGVL